MAILASFSLLVGTFIIGQISLINAECGEEFRTFLTCVSQFALSDSNRYPWGMNFGRFSDLVTGCFTKHGCGSVELLKPEQVYENVSAYFPACNPISRFRRHLLKRSIGEATAQEAIISGCNTTNESPKLCIEKTLNLTYWPEKLFPVADGPHFAICKRSMRREIGREIQQCAAKFLDKDFEVPEERVEKMADAPVDRILIDEYYSIAIFNLTQNRGLCPLEDKMLDLRQCLGNVFNSARDLVAHNSFEIRAKKAKLAACNVNCLSRLGPCLSQLPAIAQKLCDCVPLSKISIYYNMLSDCYPDLHKSHILESLVLRDLNIVRSQVCVYDTTHPCA